MQYFFVLCSLEEALFHTLFKIVEQTVGVTLTSTSCKLNLAEFPSVGKLTAMSYAFESN
jgi:hypothetical protein